MNYCYRNVVIFDGVISAAAAPSACWSVPPIKMAQENNGELRKREREKEKEKETEKREREREGPKKEKEKRKKTLEVNRFPVWSIKCCPAID